MAVKPVVRFPNPLLRTKTHEVSAITKETHKLIEDMIDTMYACRGAGLAAIQIGSLERIYIVDSFAAGLDEKEPPVIFINPKLEWLSKETETKDEGCLSLPGVFLPVKRSLKAKTTALDIHGNVFTVEGSGLYARAMQHEQDHLDNRLLYDFASPIKKRSISKNMERMTDEEAWELITTHGD